MNEQIKTVLTAIKDGSITLEEAGTCLINGNAINEETKMIFKMLKEGKLTIEQAEEFIKSINRSPEQETRQTVHSDDIASLFKSFTPSQASGVSSFTQNTVKSKPKYIRVRITEIDTGKKNVNVKVPISLIGAGLKIAKSIGPKFAKEAEVLNEIDFKEIIDALNDEEMELPYQVVDIEDEKQHIEVIIE